MVFKFCFFSFLDLKIATIRSYVYYQVPSQNVGWFSKIDFSSNKFEISDWGEECFGLGKVWYPQIFLLIAHDSSVPLNVYRFFSSLQIVSLLDSNFWDLAAKIDSTFALFPVTALCLACYLLRLQNNYDRPR